MSDWLVQAGEKTDGPISFRDLAERYHSGLYQGQTLVSQDGGVKWQPLDLVPGIDRAVGVARGSTSEASVEDDSPVDVAAESVAEPRAQRKSRQKSLPADGRDQQRVVTSSASVPDSAGRISERSNAGPLKLLSGVAGIIVFLGLLKWWVTPPTYPLPQPGATPQVSLADILPPKPAVPTLDIPIGEYVVVPGFEDEEGVSCPSLTPDLLTIVYLKRVNGQNDIFLSRRSSKEEPFGEKLRLPCSTRGNDGFPAISPDGQELLFSVLGSPTRLVYAIADDGFSQRMPVQIEGCDVSDQHVDNAQWLDKNRIRFAAGDQEFQSRRQMVVQRQEGTVTPVFEYQQDLAFDNPWPRYWVSSDLQRAYFFFEDGPRLAAIVLRGASMAVCNGDDLRPFAAGQAVAEGAIAALLAEDLCLFENGGRLVELRYR